MGCLPVSFRRFLVDFLFASPLRILVARSCFRLHLRMRSLHAVIFALVEVASMRTVPLEQVQWMRLKSAFRVALTTKTFFLCWALFVCACILLLLHFVRSVACMYAHNLAHHQFPFQHVSNNKYELPVESLYQHVEHEKSRLFAVPISTFPEIFNLLHS
jgi:hypothetical protein